MDDTGMKALRPSMLHSSKERANSQTAEMIGFFAGRPRVADEQMRIAAAGVAFLSIAPRRLLYRRGQHFTVAAQGHDDHG
jgi:hypothetical protein